MRVNKVIGLLAVSILSIGLGASLWWAWKSAKASKAATEITALFALVEIGMTPEQVEQAYAQRSPHDVNLRKLTTGSWLFQTPLQWGAVNWVMWVDFSDEAVSSVRLRLLDDKERRPSDAPPDKQKEVPSGMGSGTGDGIPHRT